MNTHIYEIINHAINICVALPFAMHIFAYIICGGYKKAASDIHNTKKEIFRSIKLRYTNSAKLGIPLEDAKSYVTKYLYGHGGPFRVLAIIEKIACFIYCLALMTTVALFLRDIADASRMIAVLAASFCFFIFRTSFSIHRLMELTVEFSVDYLDNTLKHRLAPERVRVAATSTPELSANTTKVTYKEDGKTTEEPDTSNRIPDKSYSDIIPISSKKRDVSIDIPQENANIIEAVLQEFLA